VTRQEFSPDTAVSFTNKTEILLKVALNTIKKTFEIYDSCGDRHS
jgi:hypothetical protein